MGLLPRGSVLAGMVMVAWLLKYVAAEVKLAVESVTSPYAMVLGWPAVMVTAMSTGRAAFWAIVGNSGVTVTATEPTMIS